MPLADIIRYFEAGLHFQKLQQSGISNDLYHCISEMLIFHPAKRLSTVDRLKQMRLYSAYDWPALLALKVKAPLASYFEAQLRDDDLAGSASISAISAISPSSYGRQVEQLAEVERRFSKLGEFMDHFGSEVSMSREEATAALIEAAAGVTCRQ